MMRPKTRHSEQRLPFVVEQCFPKFSESKFQKNPEILATTGLAVKREGRKFKQQCKNIIKQHQQCDADHDEILQGIATIYNPSYVISRLYPTKPKRRKTAISNIVKVLIYQY